MQGIYAITPDDIQEDAILLKTKILLKSGVKILQFRNKHLKNKDAFNLAKSLKDLCKAYQVPFIVNDDLKLAQEIQSDGIHLGQNDVGCSKARRILGKKYIIGISCNDSLSLAIEAQNNGANYIAIGSIFKTDTKVNVSSSSLKRLNQIAMKIDLPIAAIGGINKKNIGKIKDSSASMAAICSSLYKNTDLTKSAKFFIKNF